MGGKTVALDVGGNVNEVYRKGSVPSAGGSLLPARRAALKPRQGHLGSEELLVFRGNSPVQHKETVAEGLLGVVHDRLNQGSHIGDKVIVRRKNHRYERPIFHCLIVAQEFPADQVRLGSTGAIGASPGPAGFLKKGSPLWKSYGPISILYMGRETAHGEA